MVTDVMAHPSILGRDDHTWLPTRFRGQANVGCERRGGGLNPQLPQPTSRAPPPRINTSNSELGPRLLTARPRNPPLCQLEDVERDRLRRAAGAMDKVGGR